MATQVNYGDVIYLRVSSRSDRWLSGGRSTGNEQVVTRDGEGGSVETTYQWTLMQSRTTTGSGAVNYGDAIYLKVGSATLWLSGGRGTGNEHVVTRDGESGSVETTYQWTVMQSRATTGSGAVSYGDEIYLKVGSATLWLSGGRSSGNEQVVTRDGENGSVEATYKWIVSASR